MKPKRNGVKPPSRHALNLGCGKNILPAAEGWTNLDRVPLPGVNCVCELDGGSPSIPFPDNYFQLILASHVLEHITHILPLMQELHRVSAPGAVLLIRVPYGASNSAFEDPTHVRHYFPNSFMYYGQPAYARADYGYRGDWKTIERQLILSPDFNSEMLPEDPADQYKFISAYWNVVQEMVASLECVKPIRAMTDVDEPAKLSLVQVGG